MITMEFYASRDSGGLIHVTNTIAGQIGQHHVHDEESFEEWKAGNPPHVGPVNEEQIIWLIGSDGSNPPDCACGKEIWRRSK